MVWKHEVFCFLDLETTGHDPIKRIEDKLVLWHEIIEIGAVFADTQTLEVSGEFLTKIIPKNPERCLPNLINDYPKRARLGEWDDASCLNAGILNLLYSCERFERPVFLIGQNFSFDWAFLTAAFAWCRISEDRWSKCFHYSRLDTRSMAVQALLFSNTPYDPDQYSIRNESLSRRLGIEQEPYPHQALNGARQSHKIYKALRSLKR